MEEEREIGVGVIGTGFMGRTHIRSYRAAAAAGCPNRLVAVCDPDAERRRADAAVSGNLETSPEEEPLFDEATVLAFEDPDELLGNDDVDLVSICTPTDTHVDLAVRALAAGKHAIVEKPLALSSEEIQRLVDAAAESELLCMPAMCMRFWPGWRWLKECIESGEFGPMRSAVFRRLSPRPGWSPGFYDDSKRSGGALFDLHIHDSDFVHWCIGAPQSVVTAGSVDHLTTTYSYPDGPTHVVAEGGWDHASGFEFRMAYTVVFEKATADFDSSRDPVLVLASDGESETVELPPGTGYDGEIRHILTAIAAGSEKLDATVEYALSVTRLLEAEKRSLELGARVTLPG